jgi:N-acetylmuramoyl-L-alanine amidase
MSFRTFQRALAWVGLLLMALSLVWLELLPPREPKPVADQSVATRGPMGLVIIDPGHGGDDSGTMRNGIQEKDLTLDVARRVQRLARLKGFATLMTRSGDEWISLAGRAAAANREQNCVFVSIHFDEGARATASGVQTFYAVRQVAKTLSLPSWLPFLQTVAAGPNNFESQSLAGFVQESLVAGTHSFDRGTRAEQFYVVANVRHPAVLVEGGFLSNNDDITKLATEEYREQLATGITEGIAHYREIVNARQPALAVGSAAPE